MKVCTKCGIEKPFDHFFNRKGVKDGKTSHCKSCIANRKRDYYRKNSSEINKKHYEWFKSLPEKRQKPYKISARNRQKDYQCKRNATEASRRFRKESATPSWLSEKHLSEIEEFYWLAKDLRAISGQEYHVDHIVPLKGKNVCGLHVPWNLQVLPADVNISKSNSIKGI